MQVFGLLLALKCFADGVDFLYKHTVARLECAYNPYPVNKP